MYKLLNIFCFILCVSCAGYKMVERGNPLSQYGITKVSVPMFLNQSSLPSASTRFTSEFISLLSSYPGLKVNSGFDKSNDAVLIGVVKSDRNYASTVTNSQQRVVTTVAPNTLGTNRNDFYVPATTTVTLKLHVMLLQNPTDEEIKLLRSKYASKFMGNRKIIFNEVIDVSDTFNREIFDDEGGQSNFTQNYGVMGRSMEKMAKKAADSFEESVLYAF